MRKLDQLFVIYSDSHQHPLNRKIHYVCVPAIFFSLLGLLYLIPAYKLFTPFVDISIAKHVNVATGLIIFATGYYFTLSMRLALSMFVLLVFALAAIHVLELVSPMPLWLLMSSVFAIAWIGQFIGHYYEGKKPSFLDDLRFLLVGPAWTLKHLYDRFGLKL